MTTTTDKPDETRDEAQNAAQEPGGGQQSPEDAGDAVGAQDGTHERDEAEDQEDGHDEGEGDGFAAALVSQTPDQTRAAAARDARIRRLQLREVEDERDTLRATVEALQRAEVERIASATLKKPEALWAAGLELSEVIGDDGRVMPEKVTEATQAAAERLGLARRGGDPLIIPDQGDEPRTGSLRGGSGDGFADALTRPFGGD